MSTTEKQHRNELPTPYSCLQWLTDTSSLAMNEASVVTSHSYQLSTAQNTNERIIGVGQTCRAGYKTIFNLWVASLALSEEATRPKGMTSSIVRSIFLLKPPTGLTSVTLHQPLSISASVSVTSKYKQRQITQPLNDDGRWEVPIKCAMGCQRLPLTSTSSVLGLRSSSSIFPLVGVLCLPSPPAYPELPLTIFCISSLLRPSFLFIGSI